MIDTNTRVAYIRKKLEELEQESILLKEELAGLLHSSPAGVITKRSSSKEKIDLFLALFRCREDRYPYYYKRQSDGRSGYNPACKNEWLEGICGKIMKPRVSCSSCRNFIPVPFTADTARSHLTGPGAIGSYSIDQQDRCIFLAADFDKQDWQADAFAYRSTANGMGIEAAVEISKSGDGAHVWIFFSELVPARYARRLGELILIRTLDSSDTLQFDSYDRFFPNQDYCPKAGFGNLIFLPLQKDFRDKGCTVFIDEAGIPYPDQWSYLSSLHRMSLTELEEHLAEEILSADDEIGSSESIIQQYRLPIPAENSGTVDLVLRGQIAIPRNQLPKKLLKALMRRSTIANPKFFQMQKMRFSTWNVPKYIFCGTSDEYYLYLPRGLMRPVLEFLSDQGMKVSITDERNTGPKIATRFTGDLYEHQARIVEQLLKSENGVLVAPTGTGKTIMAAALIALRSCSTLILVHRGTLIQQWIETLTMYLEGIEKKHIGVLGAGRKKLKGKLDIAMLQSLARKENLEELTKAYEFVIVDECHRVPTVTFEPILQSIAARFVLGLTATPKRKDQFQSIIFMQCGEITARLEDINRMHQVRTVYFLESSLPALPEPHTVTEIWDYICRSEDRNRVIVDTIMLVLKEKNPLVISDRVEHLQRLQELMDENNRFMHTLLLTGSVGKKERKRILEQFTCSLRDKTPCCLFATGSLIGEGFDLPELDTMFLTMPISFSERLTQYVGRLHRQSGEEKKVITVYDIVDTVSGMTVSMFKKRLSAYKRLGYRMETAADSRLLKFL